MLHKIIISSLGPVSGPESVAEAGETKRPLDIWQLRGKLGFVPKGGGGGADCSEQNKNLIGREMKWPVFLPWKYEMKTK